MFIFCATQPFTGLVADLHNNRLKLIDFPISSRLPGCSGWPHAGCAKEQVGSVGDSSCGVESTLVPQKSQKQCQIG